MATSFQDDYIKTALRLPRDLHAQLMEASKVQGKSLNSELIERLRQSFEESKTVESLAMEYSFEATNLKREIERLSKLLEQREKINTHEIETTGAKIRQMFSWVKSAE